jgi:hypothetical protein
MAYQAINLNADPLGGPNTGLGTDFGDLWDAVVTKINSNVTELYGRTGGIASLAASGLVTQQIPLTDVMTAAGIFVTASPTATAFGISLTAGTSVGLTGNSTSASSVTSTGLFEFVLPATYIAGQNINMTVNCQQQGAGTVTVKTVACAAYLNANAGTQGATLIATSAATITSSAADYVFVITGTTLVPGSHLTLSVVTVITTSAGAANSLINSVRLG